MFEGHQDEPALRLLNSNTWRERDLRLMLRRRLLGERRRQVLRLDERTGRQDGRPFDHVSQLTDVAGPGIVLDHPHGLLINPDNRFLVPLVELVDERLREQREVLLPLTQRRQPE